MDLSKLTAEEKEQLKLQLAEEAKQESERVQNEKKAYEELRDATINEVFDVLRDASEVLGKAKLQAIEKFQPVIALKEDLYKVSENRKSHTWTSRDGKFRMRIGNNYVDRWKDTSRTGVAKVFEWLDSRTKQIDETFASTINDLLRTNSEGNLDPRNVLILENNAIKSKDQELIDAVAIIREGHWLDLSSVSVSVEVKDENGKFRVLPLSIAQA